MTMLQYQELVKSLTKRDILAGFPDVVPLAKISGVPSSSSSTSSTSKQNQVDHYFEGHDLEQIKLMDENCIVLDYNDIPIGAGTKKLCHLINNIEAGLLHRAFSVFLFNNENKLLLQQRADEKITFPSMWTNTCCSHPLCVPSELGNKMHDLESSVKGVKIAAVRKLQQELGIESKDIPINDFKFLTRIHYKAGNGDGIWGEHEIDYILVIKANPNLNLNLNEVKDIKYVGHQELKDMFKDPKLTFTPWFKLICDRYLFQWWDNLDELDGFVDNDIQRML
ncbi:hypothetical protein PACTADRAFT_52197 [Pachysolen tannophilus NRRL Y-2460]|uniref:Isopentenyl-diphosphate Delta-isomerase n=1 Tax=Pachysolen tannophilus NRRL Y-2460 TaxID=669874 RepID=A0A1E4TMQ1_PACTA|nr:hypothetical protein PACTADRAFT_52197 [Pachysolen tannophilus NRRL Y-2460]